MGMRIDSETLFLLNSYSRESPWNESQSFWDIEVSESLNDITRPGRNLDSGKSKQTCSAPGSRIRS